MEETLFPLVNSSTLHFDECSLAFYLWYEGGSAFVLVKVSNESSPSDFYLLIVSLDIEVHEMRGIVVFILMLLSRDFCSSLKGDKLINACFMIIIQLKIGNLFLPLHLSKVDFNFQNIYYFQNLYKCYTFTIGTVKTMFACLNRCLKCL